MRSAMPDPETAYWMLDAHGPDSMPWSNLCIGLYDPEPKNFTGTRAIYKKEAAREAASFAHI